MTATTFESRWLETPGHVRERPGDLPAGFRASGVSAGLKPSGSRDVALLVSDSPDTVSAARFTRSGVLAAPVILCQRRVRLDAIRAVVANSGNANAATGNRGLEDAARMQGAGAMAAGMLEDQVAVASTGVIGVPLDTREVIKGIAAARPQLRADGAGDFSEAIRTTDKFAKDVAVDVELPSGTVRLDRAGQGRGDDLAAFATMLCFVQTDAALRPRPPTCCSASASSARSTACRVDGQLSTNDTAILMASGASACGRARVRGRAALRRGAGLGAAAARAGDRARRRGLQRSGASSSRRPRATSAAAARAVANSPLVKAALHGGDPNWGRIAQAVGGASRTQAPLAVDVFIESVQVAAAGMAIPFDTAKLAEAVAATGSSTTSSCRATGRRRGLLLRPLARVRDDQRGLHT
jgi:glutamate N-acetyltransferase/amino-acid N-acetyltransferase